jgi:CheY-like chemotaxis protein
VINLVLDISKIEANKVTLHPESTDVFVFLGDIIESQVPYAVTRRLRLLYDFDPALPRWIEIDLTRVRQILSNLIGNALKFTEAGTVTLIVERCAAPERAGDRDEAVWIQFRVRDTGIGIPADQLPTIFAAFEQVDSETTRRFEGTGLGLAICRELVAIMGGAIEVDSEVGRGTEFRVRLPVRPGEDMSARRTLGDEFASSECKVLVVDDEALNRSVIQKLLAILGVDSEVCESGPAGMIALNRATQTGEPFDMVLVDAEMPGMDGYQMACGIVEQGLMDTEQVRILCSSASGGTPQPDRPGSGPCAHLHARGCLRKPVTLAQMRRLFVVDRQHEPVTVHGQLGATLAERQPNVLLVEDNTINQQVVVGLLKRVGASFTIANNGQEALEWVRRDTFDLVLMDVMMPIMDGVEATRLIREYEARQQRDPVPIIALTARAMKGDCDEYLRCGMNGYLAKPIARDALLEEMLRLLPERTAARVEPDGGAVYSDLDAFLADDQDAPVASSAPALDARRFDWDAAVQQLGGEEDLLLQVLERFVDDCPAAEKRLRETVAAGNTAALEIEAHALKSVCATLCLGQARQAFFELEQAAKSPMTDPDQLAQRVELIIADLAALAPSLRDWLKQRERAH